MESITAEVLDDHQKRDRRGRRIVAAERRAELLAAYDASGLTQSEFARREGINYHTLVAWLGRRRMEGGGTTPAVHFQEVCIRGTAKSDASLEVALPGGLVVRGDSAAAVAELVRALRV